MGLGKLNIWLSEVADPCAIFDGEGEMTILDCNGVLRWPCGRFLHPSGDWEMVPNGEYLNLPFRCGHLEVMVPPGCYWVVAGNVRPKGGGEIHFNETSHVGIVHVGCDQTACVKIFNPSRWLCWHWFKAGLKNLAQHAAGANADANADVTVNKIQGDVDTIISLAESLLDKTVTKMKMDHVIGGIFDPEGTQRKGPKQGI